MPQSVNRSAQRAMQEDQMAYEICRATAALMFLLEGIDGVRETRGLSRQTEERRSDPLQERTRLYPLASEIELLLALSGQGFNPAQVLGTEGEAEQLAFRGWLERIVHLTKGTLTTGPGPLTDIGLIQRDVSANGGVASGEDSARCSVLKWFAPGEQITFGMQHTLDFLNQMGLMSNVPVVLDSGLAAAWLPLPLQDGSQGEGPPPPVVSLRHSPPPWGIRAGEFSSVCVVFANALFIELSLSDDTFAAAANAISEGRVRIDENGDLRLVDGSWIDREPLYREALNRLAASGPAANPSGSQVQ